MDHEERNRYYSFTESETRAKTDFCCDKHCFTNMYTTCQTLPALLDKKSPPLNLASEQQAKSTSESTTHALKEEPDTSAIELGGDNSVGKKFLPCPAPTHQKLDVHKHQIQQGRLPQEQPWPLVHRSCPKVTMQPQQERLEERDFVDCCTAKDEPFSATEVGQAKSESSGRATQFYQRTKVMSTTSPFLLLDASYGGGKFPPEKRTASEGGHASFFSTEDPLQRIPGVSEEQRRRKDFKSYWECALQAFGVSEDGMLLKSGAKQLGFSEADGEEILRIITQDGLGGDTQEAVLPLWERTQADVNRVAQSPKQVFGNLDSGTSHMGLVAAAGMQHNICTPPCLLKSPYLQATEETEVAARTAVANKGLSSKRALSPLAAGAATPKSPRVKGTETEVRTGSTAGAKSLAEKKKSNERAKVAEAATDKKEGRTANGQTGAPDVAVKKGVDTKQTSKAGEAIKKKSPFKRVLELGAGIGRLTKLLQSVADEVVAVDFIREYVEENRKANGNPLERAKDLFVVADATSLDFPLRASPSQIILLPTGEEQHHQPLQCGLPQGHNLQKMRTPQLSMKTSVPQVRHRLSAGCLPSCFPTPGSFTAFARSDPLCSLRPSPLDGRCGSTYNSESCSSPCLKSYTCAASSSPFAPSSVLPCLPCKRSNLKAQYAPFPGTKFDLLMINWLLMYLSVEEVRRLLQKLFSSWSSASALIFIRESCGEPSDKGRSSRDWAKSGNPTVYRSHHVYTSLIEGEARRAGVEIDFIAKACPMQVYWKKSGTDSQRYWLVRVKN